MTSPKRRSFARWQHLKVAYAEIVASRQAGND